MVLLAIVMGTGERDTTARAAAPACEPAECPAPSVTPILDVRGDSNETAQSGWTPPVPLGASSEGFAPSATSPKPPPPPAPAPSLTPLPPGTSGDYDIHVPDIVREGYWPTPTPTPTPTPRPPGPAIYLTFDDGPNPTWTPKVLEVLARYNARATFFVLGANVDAYPWIAANIAAAGHAIGNHSYTHANLGVLGWSSVDSELSSTQDAIRRATGRSTRCVRPPYGSVNGTVRGVASDLGLDIWLWDVDPRDWSRPGTWAIANNVLSNAAPNRVVLMHDGGGERSQTVAALETILAELSARGYRFEALPC
jgi:peptidoglycan/xylan/chitin deacetylase (PgdA/CDA1 family)